MSEVLKRCSRCRDCKPLEQFPRDKRTIDGRHSYCKRCMNAYRREWLARNPQQRKAKLRRQRERYAIHREEILTTNRIRQRERAQSTKRSGAALEAYVPLNKNATLPLVPVGPFAEWTEREFPGWQTSALAERLQIHEDTLRRIRSGHQTVSLHIVDQAFVAADCAHLLALLYPLEEEAA